MFNLANFSKILSVLLMVTLLILLLIDSSEHEKFVCCKAAAKRLTSMGPSYRQRLSFHFHSFQKLLVCEAFNKESAPIVIFLIKGYYGLFSKNFNYISLIHSFLKFDLIVPILALTRYAFLSVFSWNIDLVEELSSNSSIVESMSSWLIPCIHLSKFVRILFSSGQLRAVFNSDWVLCRCITNQVSFNIIILIMTKPVLFSRQ